MLARKWPLQRWFRAATLVAISLTVGQRGVRSVVRDGLPLRESEVPETAFGWWGGKKWPDRGWRAPSKRSKQALISILQDPTTYEGKSKWAIGLMRKFKFFTTTWEYVLVMKKLTQVGCWDDALEVWRELQHKGLDLNAASYSAAIVALNTGRRWREAVALLDEMEIRNMAPIRIGCEHGLMACERGRLWQKAVKLLDTMWEHGMTPDEDTYLPAIRTCENAGQFELGDKLFKQMREQTKIQRVAAEMDMPEPVPQRQPPKAKPTPWRVPGALALDAYDAPKLLRQPAPQKGDS